MHPRHPAALGPPPSPGLAPGWFCRDRTSTRRPRPGVGGTREGEVRGSGCSPTLQEVKVSALELVKEELEEVKVRAVEWVGEGGKRRRVKPEREVVAAEARPGGRGAGRQQAGNGGRGASRFRGVGKDKRKKAKPWKAEIKVTEDGKGRRIHIGCFAREEDTARAFDRVSIAAKGRAEAKTNFPVAEYRAEWAELEALGVDAAVARERQRSQYQYEAMAVRNGVL